MKNKIKSEMVGMLSGLIALSILLINMPVYAYGEASGLTVPIRFKYEINSEDLQSGDGVSLEIAENIYVGNMILFKEYGSGIGYVTSFKKSSFLGRGGTIEIRSGYIQDVNGNRHNITLSSDSKGHGSLMPLVLTLASAGLAFSVWDVVLDNKIKPSSLLYATAATALPFAAAGRGGNDAKLSTAKIMFAHVN